MWGGGERRLAFRRVGGPAVRRGRGKCCLQDQPGGTLLPPHLWYGPGSGCWPLDCLQPLLDWCGGAVQLRLCLPLPQSRGVWAPASHPASTPTHQPYPRQPPPTSPHPPTPPHHTPTHPTPPRRRRSATARRCTSTSCRGLGRAPPPWAPTGASPPGGWRRRWRPTWSRGMSPCPLTSPPCPRRRRSAPRPAASRRAWRRRWRRGCPPAAARSRRCALGGLAVVAAVGLAAVAVATSC